MVAERECKFIRERQQAGIEAALVIKTLGQHGVRELNLP